VESFHGLFSTQVRSQLLPLPVLLRAQLTIHSHGPGSSQTLLGCAHQRHHPDGAPGNLTHTLILPLSSQHPANKKPQLQAANQIFSALAHLTVKTSLLTFYIRTFKTTSWIRHACYALLIITSLAYFTLEVVIFSLCVPRRSESWDINLASRCSQGAEGAIAIAVCSVAVDIAIFCMPLPAVAKLKLSRERKWGLGAVFLVGLL